MASRICTGALLWLAYRRADILSADIKCFAAASDALGMTQTNRADEVAAPLRGVLHSATLRMRHTLSSLQNEIREAEKSAALREAYDQLDAYLRARQRNHELRYQDDRKVIIENYLAYRNLPKALAA